MSVTVTTTDGQRSAKDWGRMLSNKIISVADTAPDPIRQQAQEFKNRIALEASNYIRMAVEEERFFNADLAERAGHKDVAAAIRGNAVSVRSRKGRTK